MNILEVFWNNIASLALIPPVIIIVLKLKKAQIDALREQINVLEKQAKVLGLFRISEVEKDFKALKNFYEEQKRKADRAKNELDNTIKELENVKSLSKKEAGLIVELFKKAMIYAGFAPSPMGKNYISQILYMMDGPIGELWREYMDRGKLWREMKEYERKRKKEKESGNLT